MDYILCHHGIKGQKWGVIRSLEELRRNRKGKKEESKKKEEEPTKPKFTSVKSLSDAELKQILNRMDMEKRYNQMTAKQKSATEKFVADVLSNAAKQTATKYTAEYMSKGVEYLIKKSR